MAPRSRIPPLLEPYLRLPSETSLILLTGVLDTTPHWLVTRFLRSVYPERDANGGGPNAETQSEHDDVVVLLVSWMRDWEFWKTEARRGAGLDLARLAQEDRFAFVDGLTHLFSPAPAPTSASSSSTPTPAHSTPLRTTPPRGGPLPSRTPVSLPARGGPAPPSQAAPPTQPQLKQQKNTHTLPAPSLPQTQALLTTLLSTLQRARPSAKILLILDSPTALLALASSPPGTGTGTGTGEAPITAASLSTFLLHMRAQVYSTLLSLEVDGPFVRAAAQALEGAVVGVEMRAGGGSGGGSGGGGGGAQSLAPALETEHAAFVVGAAHVARWVVGVRGLDTGVARDVSGVLRVARGGAWDGDEEGEELEGGEAAQRQQQRVRAAEHDGKQMEVLYFVQNDGGVRVFERGGGNIG